MRISVPSEGCVIGMPTPRKESVASERMARPRLSVAETSTGVSVLGRMWRSMIRAAGTWMMRAARTYSLRRSTIVSARTTRAYCTQLVREIASTSTIAAKGSRSSGGSSPRNTAETRIAISRVGIERTVSPSRISRLSMRPPWKPASRPTPTPISIETSTAAKPMMSEMREP